MKKTPILVAIMFMLVFLLPACSPQQSPPPPPSPVTPTVVPPTELPVTPTVVPPTEPPAPPTVVPATAVEIPGFPLSGANMENTDRFTINGSIKIIYQCESNTPQPFGIQVYDSDINSPVGNQIMDTTSCAGNQVIDFGGKSFTGYLIITAIGNWKLDAYTMSS